MTLPLRRALAFFFICLFAIVAPAALAYGRGYRFSWTTRSLRQTGVIFLAGEPKNVQLFLDGQPGKMTTLPKTIRSIVSGTHTVGLHAEGYTPQQFAISVQAGQTTMLTSLQLFRPNPFTTVRTGVPRSAVVSPTGDKVAWVADGRVHIASPTVITKSSVIEGVRTINWSGERIDAYGVSNAFLGTVSNTGSYTLGGIPTPVLDARLVTAASAAKISIGQAQRVDKLGAWLVTNSEGAWLIEASGATTLVSRWAQAPLAARMLSTTIFAIVRSDGITLRNLVTNQTETYEATGITAVAKAPREGELNLLQEDGDLRSWVRAEFF